MVNRLKILSYLLAFLPAYVVQAGPHQVHDAQLYLRLRENCLDSLREPLQSVNTGDKDILHSAIAQIGQHLQPELGALVGRGPQAQYILASIQTNADGHVDSAVFHPASCRIFTIKASRNKIG